MANCLQFALANSVEGRDAEFNEWYDSHLPYVVTVPNYSAGQRFRRADGPWPEGRHEYLTVWELDDPAVTLPEMAARRAAGESHHSEAIDPHTIQPPTMWRRAMVRNPEFDIPISERTAVVLAFFNGEDGCDDASIGAACAGFLTKLADEAGVLSTEFLTLAQEQIRNRARKFRHAVLVELRDGEAAPVSLADAFKGLPHGGEGQWNATLFKAMGPRVTTHDVLMRR